MMRSYFLAYLFVSFLTCTNCAPHYHNRINVLEPRGKLPSPSILKEKWLGFFRGHPEVSAYPFDDKAVEDYLDSVLATAHKNPVIEQRLDDSFESLTKSKLGENKEGENQVFAVIKEIHDKNDGIPPMPAQIAAALGPEANPMRLSRWKAIWMYHFEDAYGTEGAEKIFDKYFAASHRNPALAKDLDNLYKRGLNPGGDSKELPKSLAVLRTKYLRDFEAPRKPKTGSDEEC